ncbi:MAG TPA: hypothetical protein VFS08_16245 [Gemmatimonadaceae bacterium]|nr:hypothetical protein [Gemmatimonadaceae bacterium]
MITTTRTPGRRATNKSTTAEPSGGRGVPRRALADGVVERRRTTRRRGATTAAPSSVEPAAAEELRPLVLSPSEHYRRERQRRADREAGDLATLLAEAKAEYDAMLAAPRPAGKGGRPKKRPAKKADEFDLEPLGDESLDEDES